MASNYSLKEEFRNVVVVQPGLRSPGNVLVPSSFVVRVAMAVELTPALMLDEPVKKVYLRLLRIARGCVSRKEDIMIQLDTAEVNAMVHGIIEKFEKERNMVFNPRFNSLTHMSVSKKGIVEHIDGNPTAKKAIIEHGIREHYRVHVTKKRFIGKKVILEATIGGTDLAIDDSISNRIIVREDT